MHIDVLGGQAANIQNAKETANVTKGPSDTLEQSGDVQKNSKSYSEEELQLLDLNGDGEVTSEELESIVQDHDIEMERISNEYDSKHKEEASYAWKNKGAWSDEKIKYMNAKDILYRDEHPEYNKATNLDSKEEGDSANAIFISYDKEGNKVVTEYNKDGNKIETTYEKNGGMVVTEYDADDTPAYMTSYDKDGNIINSAKISYNENCGDIEAESAIKRTYSKKKAPIKKYPQGS